MAAGCAVRIARPRCQGRAATVAPRRCGSCGLCGFPSRGLAAGDTEDRQSSGFGSTDSRNDADCAPPAESPDDMTAPRDARIGLGRPGAFEGGRGAGGRRRSYFSPLPGKIPNKRPRPAFLAVTSGPGLLSSLLSDSARPVMALVIAALGACSSSGTPLLRTSTIVR